ncbi:MAG: RNA polymerase sigma factor [Oscillochloridaceae bacterium umkhey_bin13]
MALRSDRLTQPEPLSDEALVSLVARGHAEALEQLYARYSRVVYGLALRILRNTDLAEEMVQETFWRVWRRASTFQTSNGQFAPWLFGIARNLCIDELRRRQSRPQSASNEDEFWLSLPDPQPTIDEQTWEAERRRLISQALGELPADQRQVIELAYFGGLSQREIANQLDNPLGTVKTRVRLALQKLKGLLQHQGIGLEDR